MLSQLRWWGRVQPWHQALSKPISNWRITWSSTQQVVMGR
jgi:hypothetical protein